MVMSLNEVVKEGCQSLRKLERALMVSIEHLSMFQDQDDEMQAL